MELESYLFFNGRCDEAIDFYKKSLDAELLFLMRNSESPEPAPPGSLPAGFEDKVTHATLRIGKTNVMVSDGNSDVPRDFKGFCLSINADDSAQATRFFNALADSGHVKMPLGKTFWSPCFGMVEDQFGVGWMVTVAD
ncbi:MAG: VOC family protein [Rhodoferax sp.]|nr:VOC family protein [Rhodoferax sp.]